MQPRIHPRRRRPRQVSMPPPRRLPPEAQKKSFNSGKWVGYNPVGVSVGGVEWGGSLYSIGFSFLVVLLAVGVAEFVAVHCHHRCRLTRSLFTLVNVSITTR
jgi:hypothetical protein